MTRAVAIQHQDSVKAAIDSAINAVKSVNDFMYGTPERVRMTTYFALALAAVGGFIQATHSLMGYCS